MSSAVEEVRTALVRGVPLTDAFADGTSGTVGTRDLLAIETDVRAHLRGAGPLQQALDDPAVTDVLVNGDGAVWVDRGAGLVRVPVPAELTRPSAVRALAVRLAAASGQRLDDASPVVDGTLPGGTRLHAVLPPLSAAGTLISLRTHRERAFTLTDLVRSGTVPAPVEPILRGLVDRRANVLVSGSTGSGKTTLLAALLSLVGHDERIVCIEESAELRPQHPHVVHLQVRRPNVQHVGGVPLSELVRAAMRMRPDRLVLGECRGAEVRDVLGALNTGHEGGWATVHANASTDVPARLVALGSLAGLTEGTVAAQAASALDAVVHLRRGRDGRRRVVEVSTLERHGGELVAGPAVLCDGAGVRAGPGWPRLAGRLGVAPGSLAPGSAAPGSAGPGSLAPEPSRGRHRGPG